MLLWLVYKVEICVLVFLANVTLRLSISSRTGAEFFLINFRHLVKTVESVFVEQEFDTAINHYILGFSCEAD